MERFAGFIIKYRKIIIIVFIAITAISAVLALGVNVNYNIEDYLPKDSGSTIGIEIMMDEFTEDFPSANVMVRDVTVLEALEFKEKLINIPDVTSVTWLDDVIGLDTVLSTPMEFLDTDITDVYYKDGHALFSIAITQGSEQEVINEIYEIIGDENAVSGSSVSKASMQEMSSSETVKAMVILVPLIILILILSTSSWLEPLVFLIAIGVAILINMGTNIFFDDISFITKTVSPILQLAVSLDYAIFLMHSFREYRLEYEPEEAMKKAMKKSIAAVSGSAATTIIGFLALVFMRFEIGMDLGLNLVKGVALSFLSIMVFMPALAIVCIKLLDKTTHKSISMDSKKAGKFLLKVRIPLLILSFLIIIPSFLAKNNIDFEYGMSNATSDESRAQEDIASIESVFGKINQIVILVPNDDTGKETILCEKLKDIDGVTAIISYDSMVNSSIPIEFVEEAAGTFRSENYSRIILYTDLDEESARTFASLDMIHATTDEYYDEYYVSGQSASIYDIKEVVTADNRIVTLVAVLGIFLVLLIMFKSLSLPVILVFTIESAIWINLAFTYFQSQPLNYIGFLIINTVQLGATVDYAILITDRYKHNRTKMLPKEAMQKTLSNNLTAILISAGILAFAGLALFLSSSNPIVSELGVLLGRGTILSFAMIATVLPALLILLDFLIRKTTYKHGFYIDEKKKEKITINEKEEIRGDLK